MGGPRNNLTGEVFGRLTVIEVAGKNKHGQYQWLCKCDCGNEVVVVGGRLRCGHTKSCGCYNRKRVSETHKVHGGTGTRLYSIWRGVKKRCLTPTCNDYPHYGGRGITICERWMTYQNFKDDLLESYEDHVKIHGENQTTIERTDNETGYSLGNCCWATRKEQNANTRDHPAQRWFRAVRLSDDCTEESNNQHEFARLYGLNQGHINNVLKGRCKTYKGWTFDYIEKEAQ